MSIYDYSTTPGSNSSIDGTNIAEGCAPAGINNALRSLMADVAQLADDIGGALDTTGSSNTYAVTTAQTITAYADGLFLRIRANHTSSGAATLNVDSLGAKSLKVFSDAGVADAASGQIQSGGVYDVAYDSGNGYFIVLNPAPRQYAAGAVTPTVTGSTGAPSGVTYSGQAGRYVRHGNVMFVHGYLGVTSVTGGSGFGVIGGLPGTPTFTGITSYSGNVGFANGHGTAVVSRALYTQAAGGLVLYDATPTEVPLADYASSDLYFSIFYEVS